MWYFKTFVFGVIGAGLAWLAGEFFGIELGYIVAAIALVAYYCLIFLPWQEHDEKEINHWLDSLKK